MQIRTHIGISLDGFIATPDGFPIWNSIPSFVPGQSHGLAKFLDHIDAIVVGRTTFDLGHMFWTQQAVWPWEGKRVFVLTSRPLPANTHEDVIGSQGGPAEMLAQLRAAGLERDVHLLGGPRLIQGFLQLGAIDHLGMVILPVLLGEGVPFYGPDAAPRTPLRLERSQVFPDGAIEVVYALNVEVAGA